MIPYIAIIVEKEKESGKLQIQRWGLKNQVEMRIDDLSKEEGKKFNLCPGNACFFQVSYHKRRFFFKLREISLEWIK